MAPRSASIKAVTACQFWCITSTQFREIMESYVQKNFALAKQHLDKYPLFAALTDKQRDAISYNMLCLRYENDEVIFKLNDDANSFYIITDGKVEITIPGKNKLTLETGESFGEQCFQEGQVRGGTAVSRGQTICLSIGRDLIKKILGDRINNITGYNIAKWALKRSKILSRLSNVQIEKLLNAAEYRDFEDGQLVYKSGENAKYLAVSIEGAIEEYQQGQIAYEELLNTPNKPEKDYLKKGKGVVAIFTFESITRLSNKKTSELMDHICDPYEKDMEEGKAAIRDNSHIKLEQLIYQKKLGEGQFGQVYLVKESKTSQNLYALKCIRKAEVISHRMEKIVLEEKHILEQINSPLTVGFVRSFKDNRHVFLLLEYIKGFELYDGIREIGLLTKPIASFYIGSLLLSLEYLHLKNIIYRDLKPENVMVDSTGYLKLIDMGTAKQLTQQKNFRTYTKIGTPHYMAPEVMLGKGYSFDVDLWSLGILLFEFLCGSLPFAEDLDSPSDVHACILKSEVKFPSFFKDEKAKKLILQLLSKTPESRAPKGLAALKANPYFDGLVWEDIYSRKMPSPYIPKKIRNSQKLTDGGSILSALQQEYPKSMAAAVSTIPNWDQ